MSRWKSKGLVATAAASLLGLGLGVGQAYADPSGSGHSTFGQYGEINRIGGFDAAAFSSGSYNQADLTGGDFLNPSGFAVDSTDASISTEDPAESASDTTALWVMDRTSSAATTANSASSTTWRLQKLDDLGHVLGRTSFSLGFPAGSTANKDHYSVDALAVDENTGEVYAEIDDVNSNSPLSGFPYEIVAWSINPTNPGPNGVLQAPNANTDTSALFAADPNSPDGFSAPSIVATRTQLTAGPLGTNIFWPQGLAVDDVNGQDQLALIAESGKSPFFASGNGTSGGPTVVQLIDTSGNVGQLGNYWSASTGLNGSSGVVAADPITSDPLAASYEAKLGPIGIDPIPVSDANPQGGLTVLLDAVSTSQPDITTQTGGSPSTANVDVVQLSRDLSSEKIVASQKNAPRAFGNGTLNVNNNTDGAAISTEGYGAPYGAGTPANSAAPEIAPLSNGLYVADYTSNPTGALSTDGTHDGSAQAPQTSGQSADSPGYWLSGTTGVTPNIGMRLLNPDAESDGTLSNMSEPLTSVYDTLGDLGRGTCEIPAIDGGVVAGQNGAFFVLERGRDSTGSGFAATGPSVGRQIIEYGPLTGADAVAPVSSDTTHGACPGPSGTFTVSDANVNGGVGQAASTTNPLTVHDHDAVVFDAGSIAYPSTTADADGGELSDTTEAHAVPFAYEWDPGDGLSDSLDDSFATETGSFSAPLPWPSDTQSYAYPNPGIYTATMTLIGDYGTYTQQGDIVVDASTPPAAALALPSTTILAGGSVTFDGTGSSPAPDAGSSITNYHWNFGDGNSDDTGVVASDTHTYTTPGTYIATLTVRQNDQQVSAPATETVTVIAGPPTAAATSSPATATTNQGITFDASGSAPGNGSSIAGYSWDFGDGNTGSGQTASHAYGSAGTYTATVTVTDADGQSAQASTTVVVNTPPPVTTTPSTTSSTPTTTTPSITGSVPTISGKAAIGLTLTGTPNSWTAGASLTYQWYAGGAAIAGATSSTLTLTAAEVGKQVTLKVTGTLSGQTATETSLPTGVVTGKTLKTASPKITGTTKVGKTLKVKTGTWTKGTKFSYQWLAGGKAIKKATKSSLKLAKAEKGKKITVKVTGTLFGYTLVTKTSAATKKVAS